MMNDWKDNTPIIVTGSQRSGTSLTSGILFYLGVFMGEWYLKRDKHNPTGYFEDVEIGELDEQRHIGTLSKELWEEKVKQYARNRRDNWVYGFQRWGWKNPSSSLYISEYNELLNPQIIWCQRDKEETKDSINRMYGKIVIAGEGEINAVDAEKTYQKKVRAMKAVEEGCFVINFRDIIERPEYEIGRLVAYLNIDPSESRIKKALRHVIKDHKGESEHYTNFL